MDNGEMILINSNGELFRVMVAHKPSHLLGNAQSYRWYSEDQTIYLLREDGSFEIHDLKSRKRILRNYRFSGGRDLVLSDKGWFDATENAMNSMYWTKGLELIDFYQLKDRFWMPGLWEKAMSGDELPETGGMMDLKLQPDVELAEIEKGKLPVKLTKRDGGYGRVVVSINGKEISRDARGGGFDTTKSVQNLEVEIADHPYLTDGENIIEVKAYSRDGFVQGRGVSTVYTKKKTKTKPVQFFGVFVGVSDYQNPSMNLKYTVSDARAISKASQLGASTLFGEEYTHIYSLTSKNDNIPNKTNIESVFDEIAAKATSEDIVMVYLSGHGITWGGESGDFYFLTSDATSPQSNAYNDPAIRANQTISTSEWVDWLKEVPALKQVMIIDACGSGKAVDNLIASRNVDPSQIKAIDRMKDRTGMFIISGCAADAVSYEASQYGQGLLTYSLLQAMKGAALERR